VQIAVQLLYSGKVRNRTKLYVFSYDVLLGGDEGKLVWATGGACVQARPEWLCFMFMVVVLVGAVLW
jgi:hypothetical protein